MQKPLCELRKYKSKDFITAEVPGDLHGAESAPQCSELWDHYETQATTELSRNICAEVALFQNWPIFAHRGFDLEAI